MKQRFLLLLLALLLLPKGVWADTSPSPYYVTGNGVIIWYYDNQKWERGGNYWYGYDISYSEKEYTTKMVFDASFSGYAPTGKLNYFSGFKNLTEIIGIEYVNTSNITDMSYAFSGCSSLTNLDLSSFNTSNVLNMIYMFKDCSSLISIKLSNLNNGSVVNMSCMFHGCSSLTSLDLSNFNTGSVTDMQYMFYGCSSLTSLDLSSFNTGSVTYMGSMFYGCSNLTSLDLSSFNTSSVTSMGWMFYGCSNLTSLDLSSFNTGNVTNMGYMFDGCSSLTSLNLSSFNTGNVTNMGYMFFGCSSLTNLNLSSFNTRNVTNMRDMFYNCSGLTNLDVSGFNTGSVTDMSYMFQRCSSLTSLDLSSFNTSSVTDMSYMFEGCSSLTSLDVSHFNTGNVTKMGGMFEKCSSLTSLNLSSFNTSSVIYMSSMFEYCSGLTSLDLSSFNTSSVTNMYRMFYYCRSLTSLNLSNFNTGSVTDMRFMFSWCSGLTSLDLSNFDTSSVNYMEYMFDGCSSLTSIDLSSFNTSSVTRMGAMFDGCSSLTSLDLSNFDTSLVTYMDYMFTDCLSLTNITLGKSITDIGYWAFRGCNQLNDVYCYADPTTFTWEDNEEIDRFKPKGTNLNYNEFKRWNGISADATATNDWPNFVDNTRTNNINEGTTIYGNPNVYYLDYANLTGCQKLIIEGTPGMKICVLMNRLEVGNGGGDSYGGTYTELTSVIDSNGKAVIDLSDMEIVHLNAIKVGWGSPSGIVRKIVPITLLGTLFHVYNKSDWEEKFPNANVTFVDDLKLDVSTNVIIRDDVAEYWSSFYDSSVNHIADEGITVYIVKIVNDELELEQVPDRIINKGQGVLLKSTIQDVALAYSDVESTTDYSDNCLLGTDVEIINPGNAYVLNSKAAGLGFYKLSAQGKIRANKAYLIYGGANARDFMTIEGDHVTGIKSTKLKTKDCNAIYNLNGQLVNNPSKGVYIIDGKKILVK